MQEVMSAAFDPKIVAKIQEVLPMCRKQTIDQALLSIQLAIRPTGAPFDADDERKLRDLLTKNAAELSLRLGE